MGEPTGPTATNRISALEEQNGVLLERVRQLEASSEAITTALAGLLTEWRDGVQQTSPLLPGTRCLPD